MKKYQEQLQPALVDIFCDACGKSCKTPLDDFETAKLSYATLRARWGYHSRKDGETTNIDLCEACFDDVVKYLHEHKKAKTPN